MKLVIAPDSFKGSLAAAEVCARVENAARRVFGDIDIVRLPVADGGEGTLDAVISALGGEYVSARVSSPLGRSIDARYGVAGDTAVIEMAAASGITIEPVNDPYRASSRGTGELIADALARGAKKLLIGIGGSATNDCGMGMLSRLGVKFFDEGGNPLPGCGADMARISRADISALPKEDITVICDVTNPLLGARGATAVYGPQKGVKDLAFFEKGMENCARALKAAGAADCDFPGAGAAGGVGYALAGVMGAKLKRGIDAVLDIIGFDGAVNGADIVVTGEGRLDKQSIMFGKVPTGVARRCAAANVPVIALAGGLGEGAEEYLNIGNTSMFSIVDGPLPLEKAMANAGELLESAAERAFRAVRIGRDVKWSNY